MPKKKITEKKPKDTRGNFSFRLKIGEDEVEIRGTQVEVSKTIENLPNLVPNIHKALENLKPKTVATLTVKTESQPKPVTDENAQELPKIASTTSCDMAVFRILETDWGKWRPRTVEELKEAMKVNGLKFSDRGLSETLDVLAQKGKLRRWNTNTGFVYILAEGKNVNLGEEVE